MNNSSGPTQREKAETFKALHDQDGIFLIPNPWDIGTTRILTGLGFDALATTSAGFAFSQGRQEGVISRDEVLEHARTIVGATHLPVSADMENGYGHEPEAAAEMITLAAGTGLVGGSIEDFTGDADNPIYDFGLAVERVAASAEAARALDFPFAFTARAENYLHGRADLDDTIKRLQAFEAAGADVLYAPGLPDIEAVRNVCSSVSKPVNVVMGLAGKAMTVEELREAGVRRISVGASFARTALGALLRAGREIKEAGTFTYANEAASFAELNTFMEGR